MTTQITFTLDVPAAEAWQNMSQMQRLACLRDLQDVTGRLFILHFEESTEWDSEKMGARHNPYRDFRA